MSKTSVNPSTVSCTRYKRCRVNLTIKKHSPEQVSIHITVLYRKRTKKKKVTNEPTDAVPIQACNRGNDIRYRRVPTKGMLLLAHILRITRRTRRKKAKPRRMCKSQKANIVELYVRYNKLHGNKKVQRTYMGPMNPRTKAQLIKLNHITNTKHNAKKLASSPGNGPTKSKKIQRNIQCQGGTTTCQGTNETRIEDQTIYFEKQEKQYCTVHAINNCFGERILTGPRLLRYAKDLERNGAYMHGQYNDRTGNFVYYLSSLWLYRHSRPNIYLKTITHVEKQTASLATAGMIPQHIDTCYLSWGINDRMPYGHAVALKRINGTWYLLDSEKQSPIPLRTNEEWKNEVQGELKAFHTGNAFNTVTGIPPEMKDVSANGNDPPEAEEVMVNPSTAITSILGTTSLIRYTGPPRRTNITIDLTKDNAALKKRNTSIQNIYMEKQEKQFCYAHALNAAVGSRVTTGQQIITQLNALKERGAPIAQTYDENTGNFSALIFNVWLYHNSNPGLYLKKLTEVTRGQTRTDLTKLLANIAPNAKTLLLTWDEPIGHVVTLKRVTGIWHILDSEHPHPKPLITDSDWAARQYVAPCMVS